MKQTRLGGGALPQPRPPSTSPKRTMLGMMAAPAPAPVGGVVAEPSHLPDPKRTMLGGVTAPIPAPAPPGAAPAPGPPASGSTQKRTMLGMMAAPAAPPAPGPAAPDPPAGQSAKRTMLGMMAAPAAPAAPGIAHPQTPAVPTPAAPPPRDPGPPSPVAPRPSAGPAPVSNRTMLGVVPGAGAPPPPSAPPSPSATAPPGPAPAPTHHPPAAPGPPPPGPGAGAIAAPSPFGHSSGDSFDSIRGLPGSRRSRTGLLVGVAIALLLIAGAAIAAVALLGGGPEVRAAVGAGDAGEVLEVDVVGAPAGTKVRFAGREEATEAGRATFPLAPNDLHVGENPLSLEIIAPDGAADTADIVLDLRYRVRPDLSALSQDPPALLVLVDALPGSSVLLDGEPIPLDGSGHAEHRVPVSAGRSDHSVEVTVRYRVVAPDGVAADGQVQASVPVTTMQLDRPGQSLVTDREHVEVAGVVPPSASVTVGGAPVRVTEGRFLHRVALPTLGEHTVAVVATEPGKAPRHQDVSVRRVADLAAEAAGYAVDETLTYARIGQNPNIYRGQRVAFVGRIYNVRVEGGRSDVQMMVRDCPRGERCPLWVSYPAATEAELNAWVRVLGEVGGEQQFRAESGQVLAVPRVDATFILAAEP